MGQGRQDQFLAEESGEGEDPGQGQGGDGDADHGDEQLAPPLGCHGKEIVGAVMVDKDAGTQEQKGLEGGVGSQVVVAGEQGAGGQGGGSQPHGHEAQLANGGIGPDLLDIRGHQGNGGRQNQGDGGDGQDHTHGGGRGRKEREDPGH